MTSEKASAEILCWWKFASSNQKHNPHPGSNASSVWNFCARFSDVISRGNQWWRRETAGCFLRLPIQYRRILITIYHHVYAALPAENAYLSKWHSTEQKEIKTVSEVWGTQGQYSSKPLKRSIVKRILVFKW